MELYNEAASIRTGRSQTSCYHSTMTNMNNLRKPTTSSRTAALLVPPMNLGPPAFTSSRPVPDTSLQYNAHSCQILRRPSSFAEVNGGIPTTSMKMKNHHHINRRYKEYKNESPRVTMNVEMKDIKRSLSSLSSSSELATSSLPAVQMSLPFEPASSAPVLGAHRHLPLPATVPFHLDDKNNSYVGTCSARNLHCSSAAATDDSFHNRKCQETISIPAHKSVSNIFSPQPRTGTNTPFLQRYDDVLKPHQSKHSRPEGTDSHNYIAVRDIDFEPGSHKNDDLPQDYNRSQNCEIPVDDSLDIKIKLKVETMPQTQNRNVNIMHDGAKLHTSATPETLSGASELLRMKIQNNFAQGARPSQRINNRQEGDTSCRSTGPSATNSGDGSTCATDLEMQASCENSDTVRNLHVVLKEEEDDVDKRSRSNWRVSHTYLHSRVPLKKRRVSVDLILRSCQTTEMSVGFDVKDIVTKNIPGGNETKSTSGKVTHGSWVDQQKWKKTETTQKALANVHKYDNNRRQVEHANVYEQHSRGLPIYLPSNTQTLLRKRPTRLALPTDKNNVNSLHAFVRSCLLELFVVESMSTGTRNSDGQTFLRNEKISGCHFPGRVGLRCVHCKHLSRDEQDIGAATYPKNLKGLYRNVCTWQRVHFKECKHVPKETKTLYRKLKEEDKSRGRTKYWETSASDLGLVDVVGFNGRGGIMFS